ncbi:alpha/beta fold hydrolase [Williamsia soli]|uniref:alpha/beta fold hydrolase n=1 Tax=Williamsia soli TaxID=364929 RepID=UPI001A9FF026|nr:alpha/beta hydrolase [Williamsia soli]
MTEVTDTTSEITTDTVQSADGTLIGYRRLGSGPPVVIVHGSISTGEQWLQVGADLAADHSVYLVDRRGRGLSGDAERYELRTEAADITAVLAVAERDTGAPPVLVGHSFGAICTLETVRLGAEISSLVMYEPPLPVDGPVAGDHLADYAEAIDIRDYDGAMRIAAENFLRISKEETDGLAATPLWAGFLDLTPTWTRELAEIDATTSVLAEFAELPVRSLLLVGEVSPAHLIGASEYLKSTLPDVAEVVLPGQSHFAHVLDPTGVARSIREFMSR